MTTLADIMPQALTTSADRNSPTTLPATSAKTDRALQIIRRYGSDGAAFLTLFNPDYQVRYTADIYKAYRGAAPALCGVSEAYGKGTARSWIMIQLRDVSEWAGCREKLPLAKMEELANIILARYAFLKITELMHFFLRLKEGCYGKFYGVVDPIVITCALREFMTERDAVLSRLDAARREKESREDPDYIAFRRQRARDSQRRIFYSRNFYSPDFSYEEFCEIWWLFNLGYERPGHGYIES